MGFLFYYDGIQMNTLSNRGRVDFWKMFMHQRIILFSLFFVILIKFLKKSTMYMKFYHTYFRNRGSTRWRPLYDTFNKFLYNFLFYRFSMTKCIIFTLCSQIQKEDHGWSLCRTSYSIPGTGIEMTVNTCDSEMIATLRILYR